MSITIIPDCKCKPVIADLRAALIACRPMVQECSSVSGYGFYRPANPNNFTPDCESCSEDEIAAHKAACDAYDKGEYTPEGGCKHEGGMHILVAPWGIGSYMDTDPVCAKPLADIDAAIAKVRP